VSPRLRPVALFLGRALLFYALLALPWPGLRSGYASLYRAGLSQVARVAGLAYEVRVEPYPDPDSLYDVRVIATHPETGNRRAQDLSSRYYDWVATSLLVALVLASPVSWWLRSVGLLLALCVMNLFIALRWVAVLNLVYPDLLSERARSVCAALWGVPWYVLPVFLSAVFGAVSLARSRAQPPPNSST
jgi:hypothetical protein